MYLFMSYTYIQIFIKVIVYKQNIKVNFWMDNELFTFRIKLRIVLFLSFLKLKISLLDQQCT